jgi:hypothetical protein
MMRLFLFFDTGMEFNDIISFFLGFNLAFIL